MRYFVFTVVIFMISNKSSAQIVNIESRRLQSDTTGWLGKIGAAFEYQKNAVKVLSLDAEAQVEYKAVRSLYLFLVNFNLLKGEEKTLSNNLFFHLRYNYKISELFRWEAFTQLQQNNITGIQMRFLAGTGPRFKLLGSKKVNLYAGTAALYESEIEKVKPAVHHRDIRSSSYGSITYKPSENSELVSTLFYQPLYAAFSDFRVLHELSFRVNFVKNFTFKTTWNYLYDSRPAAGIPKENLSIKNGFEYVF